MVGTSDAVGTRTVSVAVAVLHSVVGTIDAVGTKTVFVAVVVRHSVVVTVSHSNGASLMGYVRCFSAADGAGGFFVQLPSG